MAANPYLNSDLSINRREVFRRAWAQARADVVRDRKYGLSTTLRQAFRDTLRRQWDLAKGFKATAEWRIARDAEAVAASECDREIMILEEARACAVMSDSAVRMRADLVSVDARLAVLRLAA